METVKRSVVARDGVGFGREGRDEQAEHRGFYGSENTLHETTVIETCHYTWVQGHRIYSTKSEP